MSISQTSGASRPAQYAPPRSTSRVYAWSFNVALVLWVIGSERFVASATGTSAATVVATWWAGSHDRIVLSLIWAAAAVGFAGLAAAALRLLFVAATGRPEPYILLGAAEQGFHVAHERTRKPAFVPRFIDALSGVVSNRQNIYRRLWLLVDREGHLTPLVALKAHRLASLVLLQGLSIAIGALPCVVIAGQHFGALDAAVRIPQAWARLQLPSHAVWTTVAAWAVVNATIVVLVCRLRAGSLRDDRVLPLPKPLTTPGAVLTGTVIDVADVAGLTRSASHWPRHYRRYTVRLEGPEFPLPVYVQWQGRRIHAQEMSDASRRLRREMEHLRVNQEAIFKVLDDAMTSRSPMRWHVTRELALAPDVAGLQVSDEEFGA